VGLLRRFAPCNDGRKEFYQTVIATSCKAHQTVKERNLHVTGASMIKERLFVNDWPKMQFLEIYIPIDLFRLTPSGLL